MMYDSQESDIHQLCQKTEPSKESDFFFFIILIHSVTGHPRVHSRYEGENYTRVLLPDHWGLGLYLKVCLSGPFYP